MHSTRILQWHRPPGDQGARPTRRRALAAGPLLGGPGQGTSNITYFLLSSISEMRFAGFDSSVSFQNSNYELYMFSPRAVTLVTSIHRLVIMRSRRRSSSLSLHSPAALGWQLMRAGRSLRDDPAWSRIYYCFVENAFSC